MGLTSSGTPLGFRARATGKVTVDRLGQGLLQWGRVTQEQLRPAAVQDRVPRIPQVGEDERPQLIVKVQKLTAGKFGDVVFREKPQRVRLHRVAGRDGFAPVRNTPS